MMRLEGDPDQILPHAKTGSALGLSADFLPGLPSPSPSVRGLSP